MLCIPIVNITTNVIISQLSNTLREEIYAYIHTIIPEKDILLQHKHTFKDYIRTHKNDAHKVKYIQEMAGTYTQKWHIHRRVNTNKHYA